MAAINHAVCLLYFNSNNASEVLTVSRKGNYNLVGLPGGKVEDNEEVISALIREVKEEVNLDIDPQYLEPVYEAMDGDYLVHTYLYTGSLDTSVSAYINNENALVGFSSIKKLTSVNHSEFYKYNLDLILTYLFDFKTIDIELLD